MISEGRKNGGGIFWFSLAGKKTVLSSKGHWEKKMARITKLLNNDHNFKAIALNASLVLWYPFFNTVLQPIGLISRRPQLKGQVMRGFVKGRCEEPLK